MNSRQSMQRLALAAASLLMCACPAAATTMFPEKFTCPIGGEKFEDYVIGSSSSWGQRPDGRPYGTLPVYPIVECPGNGLLLFQEKFTREEIAALTPLVASEAYQAARRTETPYYRLWQLLGELRRPSGDLANALLVATWETDDDVVRKARYQRAFVTAAAAVPAESDGEMWFYYNLRAANALRELGAFEEASALLASVRDSAHWPADQDDAEGAGFLAEGLAVLIAERNSHPEPTNLIPPEMAVDRCLAAGADLTESEIAACGDTEHKEAIAERAEYARGAAAFDEDAYDEAADAAWADAEANAEAAGDAVEDAESFDCPDDDPSVACAVATVPDDGHE